jgi:glycosidase
MGSRKVLLALALFFATAAPAHAAIKLLHNSFDTAYRSPFGAVATRTKVTLRLRVTGGKPTSVALHFGRRFVAMRRRGALYAATVAAPTAPGVVQYDFRVRLGKRTLWYGDNGDADTLKGGTGITTGQELVPYTLTVYAAGFTTPAWLQGAVVYSIFPDRFRDGDLSNDYCRAGATTGCPVFYGDQQAQGHPTWNEPVLSPPPFNVDFFGGDLEGVQQKLDYLKSLGVDAIWLNPIFAARSNHRYDTDNYYEVDPALGGNGAFASLAAAAKARGIRLILDGVFNHASSDSLYLDRYHRYASDGACESASSPYRQWFTVTVSGPCTSGNDYKWFLNDSLPVFNHDNAGVKDFFFGGNDAVAKHWLAAGADGWRLDAAQEIDHPWWRQFRTALKGAYPDAPLIGEITAAPADASEYLLGNELDGVMNYRFREDALAFAGGGMSSVGVDHALNAMREQYPAQALAASFSLIDSHDTQRALTTLSSNGTVDEARQRLKLAATLQYTYVGAPMTLYGDEVAVNAPGSDPFNRAPYPWPDASGNVSTYGPPDLGVLDHYTRLGRMRADLPALRGSGFTTLLTRGDLYAFLRSGGAAKPVAVVLNKGASTATATVPLRGAYPGGTTLQDQLSSATFTTSGASVQVSVGARSAVVLAGQ